VLRRTGTVRFRDGRVPKHRVDIGIGAALRWPPHSDRKPIAVLLTKQPRLGQPMKSALVADEATRKYGTDRSRRGWPHSRPILVRENYSGPAAHRRSAAWPDRSPGRAPVPANSVTASTRYGIQDPVLTRRKRNVFHIQRPLCPESGRWRTGESRDADTAAFIPSPVRDTTSTSGICGPGCKRASRPCARGV